MAKPKSVEELKSEHIQFKPIAEQFCSELVKQIEILIERNKMQLGFPIQARVKNWSSIEEKLTRVGLKLRSIHDLQDVVGIRAIFLFKRDADKLHEIISKTFTVVKQEDTTKRLREDQFGYSSFHYVVKIPTEWLIVPAMALFGEAKAEIQIRTVAQHLWADASHKLQYKNEANVPEPIKRSIYRVSAILEMVDLEFERVLSEKETYRQDLNPETRDSEKLNTDFLEVILDSILPPMNKDIDERYDELLNNLNHFGIDTVESLKKLISSQLTAILEEDASAVQTKLTDGLDAIDDEHRIRNKGVFFSHTGLVRCALSNQFKNEWEKYAANNIWE